MKQGDLLIVNFLATVGRILIVVVIGFFMTRVLVGQLGFELFGLLTAIGASGALFSVITNVLQLSIARELGVSVGQDCSRTLSVAFNSSLLIQFPLGLLIGVTGFYFSGHLATVLTVPEGYNEIASVCIALTFIQLAIAICTSPYGAMLRAHQHLRAIALIQSTQKIAVFCAALLMMVWPGNKLLFFVSAVLLCNTLVQLVYVSLSLKRFPESRPNILLFSKTTALSICRYASLALMGGVGSQIRRNGTSVILNIYFGNLVTSANGVAISLSNLIAQLLDAIGPVIQPAMNNKQGSGDREFLTRLIPLSSSIGLAVITPICAPLLIDTEFILKFWLGEQLPEYAVIFSRLVVLSLAITMVSKGHGLAMHARGDIGWMTFVNQSLVIAGIAIGAVIACSLSKYPWLIPLGELIGLVLSAWFWQPLWVSRKLGADLAIWFKYTVYPMSIMLVLISGMAYAIVHIMDAGIIRVMLIGGISTVISVAILWFCSFQSAERKIFIGFFMKNRNKIIPS